MLAILSWLRRTQFYTRIEPANPYGSTQEHIEAGVDKIIEMMGGETSGPADGWRTNNRFPYFQHVEAEAINQGWFTLLEKQPGMNNTYYVDGATNFKLAGYTKNLIVRHFRKT